MKKWHLVKLVMVQFGYNSGGAIMQFFTFISISTFSKFTSIQTLNVNRTYNAGI